MMATQPTTPTAVNPAAAHQPTDPALAAARWRLLRNGVIGATLASALVLAAVLLLVARADWWRGYAAASIATLLAGAASLGALWIGVRGSPAMLIQMFMVSAGLRGAVAVGLSFVAVTVGHYPAVPTLGLLVPYYFALLAAESACLVRGLKLRA